MFVFVFVFWKDKGSPYKNLSIVMDNQQNTASKADTVLKRYCSDTTFHSYVYK